MLHNSREPRKPNDTQILSKGLFSVVWHNYSWAILSLLKTVFMFKSLRDQRTQTGFEFGPVKVSSLAAEDEQQPVCPQWC